MTRDEALKIVLDAAEGYLDELGGIRRSLDPAVPRIKEAISLIETETRKDR